MRSALLLALLLVLPGAAMRAGLGVARRPWGAGVLAVDATLSLGFLSLVLLPLYLLRAPVLSAPWAVAACVVALVAVAWARRPKDARPVRPDAAEAVAFAFALALLLPVTLAHSGANVDDWWDLSFVSGWLADGRFGSAQMALSPDPGTNATAVHPRFLWSVWLMLQALVAFVGGEEPWRLQAGALAGAASVLVVSAQAALARALFRESPRAQALGMATLFATAAWLWGTEALPLFVRGYQDKLFAGFVVAPVLVALVIDAAGRSRSRDAIAVGAAALAAVSVHSLVFTMAAFVAVAAVVAKRGRGTVAWAREHVALLAALAVPALYPLGQAVVLASRFGDQGISLGMRDNPVVRAHLALGRLLGTTTDAWIVHPGAVFGPVALVAVAGLSLAWRRRGDDGARVLVALALAPCALLFLPGAAALAGRLWVPWMLYRLGWLVPVAPLIAYAVVETSAGGTKPRRIAALLLAAAVFALAASSGADRARRDFRDHPGSAPSAPVAAASLVYDRLAAEPGRGAVLAPPNFAEFVPARSGKPVVAFSERGTLVFSVDEAMAYERLRDRALFFFADTKGGERDVIAARYGVRWAVLPRRLVASGSEEAWLWRFGPEALLAARACDADAEAGAGCRGWWPSSREAVSAGLGEGWSVEMETRDYFLVRRDGTPGPSPSREVGTGEGEAPRWLKPFALSPADAPAPRGAVLARAAGSPGAEVTYDVPPRFVLPSVMPVWIEGPQPWEDAPADVTMRVDAGLPCRFSDVELVPHLPRERREVLEVRVDGRTVTRAARHDEALVVKLDDAAPRAFVDLQVRSLLGNPVSLSDVRLLGDPASCGAAWPLRRDAVTPQLTPGRGALLALAAERPLGTRTLVALARQAGRDRGPRAAADLLDEAVARDPSLAEAWIDLGFAHDELAAAHGKDAAEAGGAALAAADDEQAAARRAFDGAVRADSRSAWARGCAAWADRRGGRTLAAIAEALVAASLDPLYGDAWTILAYALGDLRLHALADRAITAAEATDPGRNWPLLARADLAIRRGDPASIAAARTALSSWLREHPFDAAVREKLSAVAAAAQALP